MKKKLFTRKIVLLSFFSLLLASLLVFEFNQTPKFDSSLSTTKTVIQTPTLPTSGAFEALGYWTMQRAYPGKTIPVKTYQQEFARNNTSGENFRTHQKSSWVSLGPHNIGGRTLAICLNPQNSKTIYVGSAGGGLWRSHSGGEGKTAWHPVNTGFPVKAVSAIAIPKEDSSVLYIGTGEVYRYKLSDGGRTDRLSRGTYGTGILKSIDAGKTWEKSLDWEAKDITGVQKIRINPKKSQSVFAATSEGVYVSYDAGGHWTNTLKVPMVTDLWINTNDTTQILASCGNFKSDQYGLYRSVNGGKTWTKATTGFPASYNGKVLLSSSKAYPGIVYASVGGVDLAAASQTTYLMRSKDQGITWELRSTNDYGLWQYWFAHFVLAHDADSNKVMAAGVDIWLSENAGETMTKASDWTKWSFDTEIGGIEGTTANYAHGDHHAAVSDPGNPNRVYIATDGGVFRTDDFGKTYVGLNGGLQTTQFYSMACAQQDSLGIGGGLQDNASVFYKGNKTWRRVVGGDGTITRYGSSDQEVYVSAQFLALFGSTDGGQNFNRLINWRSGNPIFSGAHFIAPYAVSPVNNQVLYAGGGTIYKSSNRGNSWQLPRGVAEVQNKDMPIASIGLSYFDENILAVATAPANPTVSLKPQILISTNSGVTFSDVTANLPDRLAIDIAFDPNEPNTLYVVFSGFGSGHIYRTTDLGATWQNISGNLPDVPHATIFIPQGKKDLLFVGNDLGVYLSRDGGDNWEQFNKGLPYPASVVDFGYSYIHQKLRVGTHGHGAYEVSLAEFDIEPISNVLLASGGFGLSNFPNPVVSSTKIQYRLPTDAQVILGIYDITGKKISSLVNGRQAQGLHQVTWTKNGMMAGVYKLILQVNGQRMVHNIVVE